MLLKYILITVLIHVFLKSNFINYLRILCNIYEIFIPLPSTPPITTRSTLPSLPSQFQVFFFLFFIFPNQAQFVLPNWPWKLGRLTGGGYDITKEN